MKLSQSKFAEVIANDGSRHLARVYVCKDCESDQFHIFVVGGVHQHIQCVECGTTYCDGSCDKTGG